MVRDYRPVDLNAVVALFERSVREVASRDYTTAEIAAWAPESADRAAWSERLASGGVFLSERDGRIAGFIRVDDGGHVDLLYVHPDFQRQGVARALMERAVSWASARGVRRLSAEVSLTARPFFERAGFHVVRRQTVERAGVSLENFLMEVRVRPSEFTVRPIGWVSSAAREAVDEGWGAVSSRIVVEPVFVPGLRRLEDFSHVVVVTFLHGASFDPAKHLVRRPRGLASMPELGIFAQRAKDRPNPLGVTAVPLLAVHDDGITVRGLDAIDGTPVLDLKPYFPQFDAVPDARVPGWVAELMQGYF